MLPAILRRRLRPALLPALPQRQGPGSGRPVRSVDLRSDTVTRPGPAMRAAMAAARVGDDVYGEDPTVNELQRRAAELFGMEDALFVPTGTMGNLISVMCHCQERGAELIVGDRAHIHLHEQGGVAQIAGIHSQIVKNLPDGTFDLDEVESKIRHHFPDPHYPRTCVICVENTQNETGGRVLPLSFLQEVRALADRYKLPIHMDGARLMNAAVALGVEASEILRLCDSVSMCLSKGLGAPAGTLVGGRKGFIEQASRVRKVLGGAMRQAGVLAAAGLLSVSDMVDRLQDDHRNAQKFAKGVQTFASSICDIDINAVETNILMLTVNDPRISPKELCDKMAEVTEEEVTVLGRGVQVLMHPVFGRKVRAVWHLDVSEEDTDLALKKLQYVIEKVNQK
ncbi:threonine aldolase 1 isoform X1 [Carcharodon carcharias]|uniref:threonine aldolase 1 isoform X1 n=2 Tax=Carcharodon carcharias TaxID=13397 RepID=UPI001B7F696E|nr:threonine aldolase 1 isoform X1 [Carcharodon carcharias]